MPNHIRDYIIQSSLRLFVALPKHIDAGQRFSRLLRGGYNAGHRSIRLRRFDNTPKPPGRPPKAKATEALALRMAQPRRRNANGQPALAPVI